MFFVLIFNQVTKAKQNFNNQQTDNLPQQTTSSQDSRHSRPRSVLVAYSTDDVVVTVTPLYYQPNGEFDCDDAELLSSNQNYPFEEPPSYEEAIEMKDQPGLRN